jgi:hypothetical protein
MENFIEITNLAGATPSPAYALLTVYGGSVPFWVVDTFAGARER